MDETESTNYALESEMGKQEIAQGRRRKGGLITMPFIIGLFLQKFKLILVFN